MGVTRQVLRHDKAVLHPIRQKDHLKFVPDYLIPASMRGVADKNSQNRKKKRKRISGQSQDQRKMMSKSKDPLQSFEADEPSAAQGESSEHIPPVYEDNNERVYTKGDSLGRSTSGRNSWKMAHKRGKFSKKALKPNPLRTAGTFSMLRDKKYRM